MAPLGPALGNIDQRPGARSGGGDTSGGPLAWRKNRGLSTKQPEAGTSLAAERPAQASGWGLARDILERMPEQALALALAVPKAQGTPHTPEKTEVPALARRSSGGSNEVAQAECCGPTLALLDTGLERGGGVHRLQERALLRKCVRPSATDGRTQGAAERGSAKERAARARSAVSAEAEVRAAGGANRHRSDAPDRQRSAPVRSVDEVHPSLKRCVHDVARRRLRRVRGGAKRAGGPNQNRPS